MLSGISASLQGLQQAGKRIEQAAKNIAEPVTITPPDETGNTQDQQVEPAHDTATELVDMKIASYDYKANLKAIRIQDEIQQSLLDILS
jgi:flagellar basal body rod protein FlgC